MRTRFTFTVPTALATAAALTALAGPAHADDGGGAVPVGDWRLGVEVIGSSLAGLGAGLLGSALGGTSVGADVQRRLDERWWLVFGATGGYDGGDSTSSSWSASVGARYTLTTGPVLVDLGARAFGYQASQTACYTSSDAEADGATCYDSETAGAGGVVDVAARVPLGEHVLLSFAVELLSGGWGRTEQGATSDDGLFVTAGLRPRLGLYAQF
ncbi:MAG: hypothetical protein KC635_23290 [Myxococcales bacterium]|nr:hypothetical protein [Myxococcales bacterium]MCB9735186.1 hypothetical protein [Deltaproteobacteria bacterium]